MPNVRLVDDKLTAGWVAVPDSDTDCGLPEALSVTETVALRDPVAVGVNVTAMVQVDPAARLEGQLFV